MILEFENRLKLASHNLHKADLKGKIRGLQLSRSYMENKVIPEYYRGLTIEQLEITLINGMEIL